MPKTFYDELIAGLEPGEEFPELTDDELPLPGDLYLIAVRINDAEEKVLCLYDAVLDSLIRSDLWLVPVAGSFLDPAFRPSVTDPTETAEESPADTVPARTEPEETTPVKGGLTVRLFDMELPLYLVAGTGAVVFLMLAAALWFFIRAKKAAGFEPELTIDDLDQGDDPLMEPVLEVMPAPAEDEPAVELPEHLFAEEPGGFEGARETLDSNTEPKDSWQELKETLFGQEEEKDRRSGKRPPGIRPSVHRRTDRDDPADTEEL